MLFNEFIFIKNLINQNVNHGIWNKHKNVVKMLGLAKYIFRDERKKKTVFFLRTSEFIMKFTNYSTRDDIIERWEGHSFGNQNIYQIKICFLLTMFNFAKNMVYLLKVPTGEDDLEYTDLSEVVKCTLNVFVNDVGFKTPDTDPDTRSLTSIACILGHVSYRAKYAGKLISLQNLKKCIWSWTRSMICNLHNDRLNKSSKIITDCKSIICYKSCILTIYTRLHYFQSFDTMFLSINQNETKLTQPWTLVGFSQGGRSR